MPRLTKVVMTTPIAEDEDLTYILTCTSNTFTLSGINRPLTLSKVVSILLKNKLEGTLHFHKDGSADISYGNQKVFLPQATMQVLENTLNPVGA